MYNSGVYNGVGYNAPEPFSGVVNAEFISAVSSVFESALVVAVVSDFITSGLVVQQPTASLGVSGDFITSGLVVQQPTASLGVSGDFITAGSQTFQLVFSTITISDAVSSGSVVYDLSTILNSDVGFIDVGSLVFGPDVFRVGLTDAHDYGISVSPHVAAGDLLRHSDASTVTRH